jgi:AcrR family transcriptional regulator
VDATTSAPPPPPARPMRADARRNRERILQAAHTCFAELGGEVQMEEVARCAGVGMGTVYRNFPTKEALAEAVAVERLEAMTAMAEALLEHPDPGAALEELLRTAIRRNVEDRCLCEVKGGVFDTPAMIEAQERVGAAADAVFVRAREAGAIRADAESPDAIAFVYGIGQAERSPWRIPLPGWERLLGIVLAGLRPTDGPTLPPPTGGAAAPSC